jgi:hypothetical protein
MEDAFIAIVEAARAGVSYYQGAKTGGAA